MYDYPKTKDEWWNLVEQNKDDLQGLIASFHPSYCNPNWDMPITAPHAEQVCQSVRKQIVEEDNSLFAPTKIKDPQDKFRIYLATRDPLMLDLMSETWFGMPESMEVRSCPGFGVLCDLCSEGYVLEEGTL